MRHLSPYSLWLLLSLPAFGMAYGLATASDPDILHHLFIPAANLPRGS